MEVAEIEAPDVDNVETQEEEAPEVVYSLEVLIVIKDSQQQHGLRHGDYQRYRSYCTRRLRRIRKCVNLVQGAKRRFVQKKVIPEKVTDLRCLYIPLVEAERCWAYAMQLKNESNEDHRKRYHMLNKLRKAEQYAIELAELCDQISSDPRTKLEVQAYREWMSGSVQFEMQQWQPAMELLTKAKVIYEKLSSALSGDAVAIYKQKVNDIEPSLRYCAYNIGDATAANDLVGIRLAIGHTDSVLDELIQKTRERQADSLHEVTWRNRVIPIKNDKIRVFLLAAQESDQEVNAAADLESKIEVYDRVIKECVEALQVMKDDLKSDTTFRQIQRGQEVEGRLPAQVFLHTYLLYIKIQKTVQRNLLMVELYKSLLNQPVREGQKVVKPQDLARLYEIIIQSVSEIPALPGLQEDVELEEEISIDVIGNKAFRCYYLAVAYSVSKQWPEVVALSKRSNQYAGEAVKIAKGPMLEGLKVLVKDVDALLIQAQASSILDSSQDLAKDVSKLSITSDKRPLVERLDDYLPEDPKINNKKITLLNMPPDMEPIPCKPLFFDLAFNHVEMPKLAHKTQQQEKKAGLTGFVKSWIGGWGGGKK